MASRRCWVGGNYKSAATLATVHAQVKLLNEAGAFPPNVDVVIAPSALHIGAALASARPEVTVAIQNIHTAKVRWPLWPLLLPIPPPPHTHTPFT